MAVDTCRGEKHQSHKPKMLEDGKKVVLIGGIIVHFGLGGRYPITFGWRPLVFCSLSNILKCRSKLLRFQRAAEQKCVWVRKSQVLLSSRVSLVNGYSKFCGKGLLYSSICLIGSVAERSKALV